MLPPIVHAGETMSDSITWLSQAPPILTKTGELPNNIEPRSTPTDCELYDQYGTKRCIVPTSLGEYRNGTFNDGTHGTMPISTIFLPSGNTGYYFVFWGSWTGGYKSLNPSLLSWSSGKYIYSAPWDFKLLVSTGDAANIEPSTLAFSNNGEYAVAYARAGTGDGIMVFDLTTMKGKLISTIKATTSQQLTPGAANLAVSDDGRYVASSYSETVTTGVEKGLRVYDTATCSDQLFIAAKSRKNCDYKNIWTGQKNGATYGDGIAAKITGNPERPLNVRFKDDATISFSVVHDYVSSTNFQVSTYEVTYVQPAVPEKIKLLAMGDSYISGEGAYSYRDGTDTSNNKCHLSSQSYPYLLGAQYADEYHSVACSGAVTDDVTPQDDNLYEGQVNDGYSWKERGNKDSIMLGYLPGYSGQYSFITSSKPNTILLSIGGNDIHFADLVTACVLSGPGDPCYSKQSERKILLDLLYNMHTKLVGTYQKILSEASAGVRLYVIGYPQVVNPTGNCAVNVHLDDQERQFAYLLIDRYNAVLKNAAESVGAVYVDTSTALVGHRLCDTKNDGVNGLTEGDDKAAGLQLWTTSLSFGIGNESYHPTTEGHQLLAAAIAKATDNLTKKPAAPTGVGKFTSTGNETFITSGTPDDAGIKKLVFSTIANVAVALKNQVVTVASQGEAAANAAYQLVMHSQEVTLASGMTDASGAINIKASIPNIEPGIHSLHIYTTNTEGEPIDITQNIFIAASSNDYDGDGISNETDPQPFINETGVIIVPDEPKQEETADKTDETSGASVASSTGELIAESGNTTSTATKIIMAQTSPIKNEVNALIDQTASTGAVLGEVSKLSNISSSIPKQTAFARIEASTKHNTSKMLLLICGGIGILAGAVIIYKHKRSNKHSVKMQS